jgi:hypothetical protein
MMNEHVVTASRLRLRSAPEIASGNVVAILQRGEEVELLEASGEWSTVRANLSGEDFEGYSASRHLRPKSELAPRPEHRAITPVELPASEGARIGAASARAFPLANPPPSRDPTATPAEQATAITRILRELAVERSARYLPTAAHTYCNIYAYDVTRAAAAYLPRVWWMDSAIAKLVGGERVPVVYGKTVREMNANSLYDWLDHWSERFGWRRSFEPKELQQTVNLGGIGVVCAKRVDIRRSGHITCVVPETTDHTALRRGEAVIAMLQSQAGSRNKQYFSSAWWNERSHEYSGFGFWVHD